MEDKSDALVLINESYDLLKCNPPKFNCFYNRLSFVLPSFVSGSVREYNYIASRIYIYGDKCAKSGDSSGAYSVHRAAIALTSTSRDTIAATEILDSLRADSTLFYDGNLWREINWRCQTSAFWVLVFSIFWFFLKLFSYNKPIIGLPPRAYFVYGIAGCLGYVASWVSVLEYDDTQVSGEKNRLFSRSEIVTSPIFAFISGAIVYMVIKSKFINIIPNGVNENIAIFLFSFLSGFKGPLGYRIIDKLGTIANKGK